jgi:hypothetical protein
MATRKNTVSSRSGSKTGAAVTVDYMAILKQRIEGEQRKLVELGEVASVPELCDLFGCSREQFRYWLRPGGKFAEVRWVKGRRPGIDVKKSMLLYSISDIVKILGDV